MTTFRIRKCSLNKSFCNDCHLKFLARDNQTPLQGKFGINLMVLIIFLKFIVRGVLRKTTSFLDASFTLKLAPASVQAIIERAAQAGEKEYSVLKKKIKAARLLYIDFHLESWFTCIKIVGVQPTNNYAEQAIRTWQYQKLDIKKGLSRMLSANLC